MKVFRQLHFSAGDIYIAGENGLLTNISFCKPADAVPGSSSILEKAQVQFEEYFAGKRKDFDLPYLLCGTDFQIKVWQALTSVPYGQTASYGDIAAAIGSPKAARAVGMANNRNRLPIIIPCHRIIGTNGNLTGYAGGLLVKKFLLELEKTNNF